MADLSEWIITRLRIQGFRSLQDVTLTLEPVTVLVGPNGAGKSSLVSALVFLQDSLLNSPEQAFRTLGGFESLCTNLGAPSTDRHPKRADSIALDVEISSRAADVFRGNYFVRFKSTGDGNWEIDKEIGETFTGIEQEKHYFEVQQGKWVQSVDGIEPRLAANRLALPLLSGVSDFLPLYTALSSIRYYDVSSQAISALHEPDQSHVLSTDGSNAASVLRYLQKDKDLFGRVMQTLQRIVGSVRKVTARESGRFLTLSFEETISGRTTANFEAQQMSEGTLRALGVLLAAYTLEPSALIILEEPERAIHPGAAAALAEALQEAGLRTQILVTTHSPDLITYFDIEGLRAVKREKGITQVGTIKPAQMESIKESLFTAGEIHRFEGLSPS